jgi:hypothetical protein
MHTRLPAKLRPPKPLAPSITSGSKRLRCTSGIEVVQALFDVVSDRTLVRIRFIAFGGSTRETVMAMSDFWTRQTFAQRMIEEEFPLPGDREEIARLHVTLKNNAERAARDPARRVEATPLQGWHEGKAFVIGDRVLPNKAPLVFLRTDRAVLPRVARRGTSDGWTAGVAAHLPCSSRMVLAACAALTPPLLAVWGGPIRGFGFDFSGPSRSGKTSTLRVARSIIGGPEVDGWNITRAGAAQYLLGHRGLPVILDGTTAARPGGSNAVSIVQQLTDLVAGGQPDILHSGSRGELEKAGVAFQSVLLSSTEGALPSRQRGQQARLIEVPSPDDGFGIIDHPVLCQPEVIDTASAGRWIEAVMRATEIHHGHAFPRFVHRLLKLGDALKADVRELMDAFRDATQEADGDRWARSLRDNFAVTYAAGALACRFGVFPFEAEVVQDRLRRCMLDALARADAPAIAAAAQVKTDAEAIREWLHANWATRVHAGTDGIGARNAYRNPITVAKDADGAWIYLVRKESLAKVVPDQRRLDEALKLISSRSGLRPSKGEGTLTRQKRLADGTKQRFLFFVPAFANPKKANAGSPKG